MNIHLLLEQALAYDNLSASELARRTGLSQATVSRALQHLPVLKLGAGRNTMFAWLSTREAHSLYAINSQGQPETIASVYCQPNKRMLVIKDNYYQSFDDIPWYLQSAIPAGFLGRWHGEHLSQRLGINKNPARWTHQEALHYFLQAGEQLPGNLMLGKVAAQRYLDAYQALAPMTSDAYDQLAAQMLQHGFACSSVAGEQPKFLAYVQHDNQCYHAIVKYSPPFALNSPAAQRYRDLLKAEHLALRCLQAHSIPAAQSRLIEGERLYLEVQRFDRMGEHGRRGIVSLKEVDAEFIGGATHWHEAADALCKQGLIDETTRQHIHLVYAFGHYIANTDMHFGNLAFYFEDLALQGLAPIYDMLPMFYMPVRDEIIERTYKLKPLIGIEPSIRERAENMAHDYWQSIKALQLNFANHPPL